MTTEQLLDRFDLPDFTPAENTWTVIHEGLAEAHPQLFHETKQRALRLGLDSGALVVPVHDLVEVGMKRGNQVSSPWSCAACRSQGAHSALGEPHVLIGR